MERPTPSSADERPDPVALSDAPTAAAELSEGQRLHPLTLVQRVLISLPALFFALIPLWRRPDTETWIYLIMLFGYGVFALPLILVQYLRFRYRITPKEIVIQSGVLNRQNRSIPIERIQNIEIEQSLLPRLFGTAKVKIVTAGSTGAEGVLEYVSLSEAADIRKVVRAYQRRQDRTESDAPQTAPLDTPTDAADHTAAAEEEARETLLALSLRRVLLSGAFRFSLLYIALAFSAIQYLGIDVDEAVDWVMRSDLEPFTSWAKASPILAGLLSVLLAAFLSWLTGILINLNKYYGFRLWMEGGDKLHKRSGLLTVSEGTIPLQKVQALILRTNPLMRRYDWYALKLQTMGLDVQQSGYTDAAPFAHLHEAMAVAQRIRTFDLPPGFHRVSKQHIRRVFIRYLLALSALVVPLGYYVWRPAFWGFVLAPLLLGVAYLQWRHHGYALLDETLYVRRGVVKKLVWIIPVEKFQVLYRTASIFQRRLGLKSIYVDTAGAGGLSYPEIQDLDTDTADAIFEDLHARFNRYFEAATASVRGRLRTTDPAQMGVAEPGLPLQPEAEHPVEPDVGAPDERDRPE